jgi:hypothetical protein
MALANPAQVRTSAPLALAVAVALAGCSAPSGGGAGLPEDRLEKAIGAAVGSPETCVLLADRATGHVVYRYGQLFNCQRGLPACDRKGAMSANDALALAATPGGRGASCPSNDDGSRMVGWAEGRVSSRTRDLVYSAVMEGQSALPGHEIAARLDSALQQAGL